MNNIIKPSQFAAPATQGQWIWDANSGQWICDGSSPPPCPPPSMPCPPPFPCPPPGFPPPGCPPWFSGQNSPPWYPGANAGISFGQTPPPNPVRGHMFYDGATLWLFDGASWEPIGGQAAVAPTPPSGTPPANPQPGMQWFNGTTLYVWDGAAWVPVSQTKTSIQATAPVNPNPGDLWYDGSVLRIWSGTAWALVGPGATVGPVPTTTLAFGIAQPTNVNVGSAAWVVMPFSTNPQVDSLNGWNATTRQYIPTKAGVYQFMARGHGSGASDGIALVKNGAGSFQGLQTDVVIGITNTAAGGWLQTMGMTPMNGTTDMVQMFVYSTTTVWDNAGQNLMFSAWLMP